MKIKNIEICGFKSFPDKTLINLDSPITAVVGPNGCGKSNIVDSIKWVIGETSMKELRGNLLQDVVFAGSEIRSPLNMAEVSLSLSNTEGELANIFSDATEISVKRRFFRDGESEFFINNTPCRLKDIADLFMDSGVGVQTYSIIEQGKVDMIVSSKPEEKRLIIEEAAGITKYNSRKNAAQRKMDSTRQNLLRVGDILSELKRQILSITRQANKAERYKVLKGEFDSFQLTLQAKSYLDIRNEAKKAADEESPARDELTRRETLIARFEGEIETLKLSVIEEENDLNLLNEQIFTKSSEIQRAQGTVELLSNEEESLRAGKGSKGQEIENLIGRIAEIDKEIEFKEVEKEDIHLSRETLNEKIQNLESELLKERELLLGFEAREEELKVKTFEIVSMIAELRNNLVNSEKMKREIELRIDRLGREKSEISLNNEKVLRELNEFKNLASESINSKKGLEESLNINLTEIDRLKMGEAALSSQLKENSGKFEEAKARLNSLLEYESQMKDLETPMKELLSNSTIIGSESRLSLVADLFKVKEGFETAVQAALGPKFRGVVVDGDETKFNVVKHIRSNNLLRNIVINKSEKKSRAIAGFSNSFEGLLGSLREFVETEPGNEAIADLLFGNYIVFSDLESANKFFNTAADERILVTLEGDLVESSGIIESGRFAGLGGGVFERRSEISGKRDLVSSLGSMNGNLEGNISQCKKKTSELENFVSTMKQDAHNLEIKITSADKDISRSESEINENAKKLLILGNEITENEQRLAGLIDEYSANEKSAVEYESVKVDIERDYQDTKKSSESLKFNLDEKQKNLFEFKAQLSTIFERTENLLREIDNLGKVSGNYRSDISLKQDEIAKISERMLTIEGDLQNNGELIKSGIVELDLLKGNLEKRRGDYQERKNKILDGENTIKNEKILASSLQSRLNELTLKVSELKIKESMLIEQIKNSIGMDLEKEIETLKEKIPKDEDLEAFRGKALEIKEKIDSLGDVNIGAIEELKELENRHQFLTAQKEDLENTLVNLDKMIKRINQISKKRFKETFDIVNEKFKEVFPKLFEGGKAYLTLLDEENLLETGIDIVAQPTGKKLQNINLLSGGEKALTAIALIIAIFLYKPSPFCILDEVDAPLDDANVLRFINIIKELSTRSQFIVITHNKVTMEVADTLYGITMEEHGVSKVVSVRFTDELERRKLEATLAA